MLVGPSVPSQLFILGDGYNPFSVIFLIICTCICNRGTDVVGKFNTVLNIMKLTIFTFIIGIAFYHFDRSNLSPFLPESGLVGVLQGSNIIYFSYLGFDFICTLSDESINPSRDIPKAMTISIVAITVLYSVMALAVTAMGNIGGNETALVEVF